MKNRPSPSRHARCVPLSSVLSAVFLVLGVHGALAAPAAPAPARSVVGASAPSATLASSPAAVTAPATSASTALPDLDLIVHHETEQTTRNGIHRTERWSEHFVRRAGLLWVERILPTGKDGHEHDHDAHLLSSQGSTKVTKAHAQANLMKASLDSKAPDLHGHKHFDYDAAARLVERDAKGVLTLRFVDAQRRMVVSVPAPEFGSVGFDGRWDAAAYLVPPSVIGTLPKQPGAAPAGAQWRGQSVEGWTHRVLWSDAKQVALRIESARQDGSFRRSVRVESTKVSTAPWTRITDFDKREYDDFMD